MKKVKGKSPAKPKPGHVVRLDPEMWRLVSSRRAKGESVSSAIRRIIEGEARKRVYALPSDLIPTLEEARGRAVIRAVRKKGRAEKPVAVRVDE